MRFITLFMTLGFFFFFNDTATTEIYTLSLHDALPIWTSTGRASSSGSAVPAPLATPPPPSSSPAAASASQAAPRSEEHTSELQSLAYLVCRLLLEKKKHVTVRKRDDIYGCAKSTRNVP